MPWQARSLRLTVFPIPGADLNHAPNWERLVAQPPEQITNRGGQRAESGPFGRGVLQLSVQSPLRADLVYAAVTDSEQEPGAPTILGPIAEHLDVFQPLAEAFLEGAPQLQRVAFGAELLSPTSDRDEAYRYFNEAIPGARLDLDGASEFLYQINRARDSRILRGVRLNRLAKWSANKWQQFALDPNVGQRPIGPEGWGAALSLDINTAPDYREAIPQDRLAELYRELVGLGQEIALRGDIR